MKAHVEVYQGKDSQWRWRAVASNGKIVADSAEGYRSFARCVDGLSAARIAIKGAVTCEGEAPRRAKRHG